jgi:hypothetical protein
LRTLSWRATSRTCAAQRRSSPGCSTLRARQCFLWDGVPPSIGRTERRQIVAVITRSPVTRRHRDRDRRHDARHDRGETPSGACSCALTDTAGIGRSRKSRSRRLGVERTRRAAEKRAPRPRRLRRPRTARQARRPGTSPPRRLQPPYAIAVVNKSTAARDRYGRV